MKLKLDNFFLSGVPLQLLYSIKLIWISAASLFNITYLISDLNYLLNFPLNLVFFVCGVMGAIGAAYKIFLINYFFALSNLLLYSIIFLTFYLHSEYLTVSGGNYFIDILGSIFLLLTINKSYRIYKKLNEL